MQSKALSKQYKSDQLLSLSLSLTFAYWKWLKVAEILYIFARYFKL
jgi:hypothetical protein